VYACGNGKEVRTIRNWLTRQGFDALPVPAETPLWADETRRLIWTADVVVAVASGRGAGPVAEFELGVAAGMGKRVLVVGRPERLGYGFGGFVRCDSWEQAQRALLEIGTGAPDVVLSPNDLNYVLKFWNDYAAKTINLAQYIDTYAPGLAARVGDHARARGGIYKAVCEAWVRAGRPGRIETDSAGDSLSPEARTYADHAATCVWFDRAVKLAEIDQTRDSLARDKESVLAEPWGSDTEPQ
jgi:hypothetical protein